MFEMTWNGRWLCKLGIVFGTTIVFGTSYVCAQITPDGTLPNNSIVTPNGNALNITGGTSAGGNLFHSFSEFSVPNTSAAIFNNALNITNIISRVTGGSISNINGLIGTSGSANLFLINPNGIIFGQNARLDLGGSFVASTASAIQFGNQGFFSATNPDTSTPLLTINPTALFYNRIAGRIENNSVAPAGISPAGFRAFGLRVPDGKSLLLIGGNISMNGGELNAYGGRIELSGLANTGSVALNFDGDNVSAGLTTESALADVSLTNQAFVFVQAGGGGSITLNARNIDITSQSVLSTGIGQGLGEDGAVAGDITLNAKGEINIESSTILSGVLPRGVGNGGNININAASLSIVNGAQLQSAIFYNPSNGLAGRGNAGNVNIDVTGAVTIAGVDAIRPSGIYSLVSPGGVGNAGNINLKTGSLTLRDGGELYTVTLGIGNAGNTIVNARGSVSFDGSDAASAVGSRGVGKGGDILISAETVSLTNGAALGASTSGQGNAGNIEISAETVSLTNGAQLIANTFGKGDAGNVIVSARGSVLFDGTSSDGRLLSAAGSTVEQGGVGKGGDIKISAESLSLTNGALLTASTSGQGDAGNIEIKASDSVNVSGTSSIDGFSSGLFTSTDSDSTGIGGDITVNTPSLRVSDGAVLDARTGNNRNGGNITLNVRQAEIFNGGQVLSTSSGAGNAGNIIVNATDRIIVNGSDSTFNDRVTQFPTTVGNLGASSGLFVLSESTGSAGNIEVTAPQIVLDNTGTLSAESILGDGGNITISSPGTVTIGDGAEVVVNSRGTGTGGDISVQANSLTLDRGTISAETARERGGNITLRIRDLLLLRRDSRITTNAGTESLPGAVGDGGNVNIDTRFLVALPSIRGGSDITANASYGNGGRINLTASGIFGIEFRQRLTAFNDITASSDFGQLGVVEINEPFDPSQNLVELPVNVVDPSDQIAQNPCTQGVGSEFIITGRGGLPPTPNEDQTQIATVVDLVESAPIVGTQRQQQKAESDMNSIHNSTLSQISSPVVPAQGWVFNDKGDIVLTAHNSTVTRPQRPSKNSGSCLER